MATIIKNNRSYDGGDVTITGLGIVDLYAEKIEYTTKQEHKLHYGMSRAPRSWSKGKKEYSCTLELYMEDVVAIQKTLPPGQSLIDIKPFYLIVSFVPDDITTLPVVTDKLLVKFQETGRAVGADTGLKKSFEMFALDIQENIQ